MITWNLPYLSNGNFREAIRRLQLDGERRDVLVRIHTAVHRAEEAVELAAYVKELIPGAKIFGTTTATIIHRGRLLQNQCIISITMPDEGAIHTQMIDTVDKEGNAIAADALAKHLGESVDPENTSFVLTFSTANYYDINRFVEACNDTMPGVKMIGGLSAVPQSAIGAFEHTGFVFDETGATNRAILTAVVEGKPEHSIVRYVTGAEAYGETRAVDEADGNEIISTGGRNAAERFLSYVGSRLKDEPELGNLFPYVYADAPDIPYILMYREEDGEGHVYANHNVVPGKKVRRALIYDRKIEVHSRRMYSDIEKFEYAQTIFAYGCFARLSLYPNSSRWELSPYEETDICGCITAGEIVNDRGKNYFANCALTLCVAGETKKKAKLNEYPFRYTESLFKDNEPLLNYLIYLEEEGHLGHETDMEESSRRLLKAFGEKLLTEETDRISNMASLMRDMRYHSCDRVCMIHIPETSMMKTMFGEEAVSMRRRRFIRECVEYSGSRGYAIYEVDNWTVAVGSHSYRESYAEFEKKMRELQGILQKRDEDRFPIIPYFCLINGCTTDNVMDTYNMALFEMQAKHRSFSAYEGGSKVVDEEAYRERYRMIEVILSAVEQDGVIPYYQGVHHNQKNVIRHYEALMRLRDDDGNIYVPGQFMDIAREFGMMYEKLSRMMLGKVFERFRDVDDIKVSMNLGVRDVRNDEMMNFIYEKLAEVKHPENFIFEILEDEDIEDYDRIYSVVERLHRLGGKISLDDFGSGYSNLQHVINLKVDYLKIDGSIVRNCTKDERCERMISMLSTWRDRGAGKMQIIAEFVENEEIQGILLKYGIDYSQGYLFSEPGPNLMSE